jgi:hypothetical protein
VGASYFILFFTCIGKEKYYYIPYFSKKRRRVVCQWEPLFDRTSPNPRPNDRRLWEPSSEQELTVGRGSFCVTQQAVCAMTTLVECVGMLSFGSVCRNFSLRHCWACWGRRAISLFAIAGPVGVVVRSLGLCGSALVGVFVLIACAVGALHHPLRHVAWHFTAPRDSRLWPT